MTRACFQAPRSINASGVSSPAASANGGMTLAAASARSSRPTSAAATHNA